jgi:SAM-dependent methyltransferase
LTRDLAERCGLLIGVDSDDTIDENAFVHQRFKTRIEDFRSDKLFDLVTFRMVAEHITNPQQVIESLVKLTKPGGKVVIYTVNRWSPVPLITWMVPFRFHHSVKELLWGTERKDTFPVAYRMNTRGELVRLFEAENFRECYFGYLDDCRSLARFRVTLFLELCAWKFARSLGFRYPETCLLGVYERHH